MVSLKITRALFALGVLLMPLSYSTKEMLGLSSLVWVNPTLVLGLLAYVLRMTVVKPRGLELLVLVSLISSFVGVLMLQPEGLQTVIREPSRLALNVVWFRVACSYIRREPGYVLRWLSYSVVLELILAIWLWLGFLNLVPLKFVSAEYVDAFRFKQLVWFDGIPIQRLLGTFSEGPVFGLFMFSCFVLFVLSYVTDRDRSKYIRVGMYAAAIGTLGSLADQILLALLLFIVACGVYFLRGRRHVISAFVVLGLLFSVITPYVFNRITEKIDEVGNVDSSETIGTSGGERSFHTNYGVKILEENPLAFFVGIGPGRYGEYAEKTGFYPPTVTMQVTVMEWLVEYGLLGLSIICSWLFFVCKHAVSAFGIILGGGTFLALMVAVAFQSNWKWESWFLALAFLTVSRYSNSPSVMPKFSNYRTQRSKHSLVHNNATI